MVQRSASAPTRMVFLLHGEDPFRTRLRLVELVRSLVSGGDGGATEGDLAALASPALGALLGACFFAFLCWGSLDGAAHAWNSNEFEGEGALRVPVWPARFVIVIGTALAAVSYIFLMLENTTLARAGKAPAASAAQH